MQQMASQLAKLVFQQCCIAGRMPLKRARFPMVHQVSFAQGAPMKRPGVPL